MDAWPHVRGSVIRDDGAAPHVERRRHRTLPILLTVDEAADLLRTTRRAIYAMIARRQLPGVVRVRRRVLLRTETLLHWLEQKCAPSLEER
jgi:excisionase family DNA binding protein